MEEWIDFSRWEECKRMERPGYAFEVVNDEGQSMLTTCTVPLPMPTDWSSCPVKFRMVPMPAPRHSDPMPLPRQ